MGEERTRPKLRGDVVVAAVFAADGVAPSTPDERNRAWDRLLRAEDWLVEQAARFDAPLSFDNQVLGLDDALTLDLLPRHQADPRCARRIAGALGYDSLSDLHATVLDGRPRSPGVLLVVFGSGEGHARALAVEATALAPRFLEAVLCFDRRGAQPTDGRALTASLLRAFGAVDLADGVDPERDLANRERFPADVMLGDVSLGRAVAGPLTAHLVGWTSAFDPSFEAALPPGAWEARGR